MPVKSAKDVVTLSGAVTVEEAQALADFFRRTPGGAVRMTQCTHLHTAALQVLLAARPRVLAPPVEPFLARWIVPVLSAVD